MKVKSKRGKPINLYLRDEDVAKVRDLTAVLAERGERTSDSLIVRAAVHAANPGRAFLDTYRKVASAALQSDLNAKRIYRLVSSSGPAAQGFRQISRLAPLEWAPERKLPNNKTRNMNYDGGNVYRLWHTALPRKDRERSGVIRSPHSECHDLGVT